MALQQLNQPGSGNTPPIPPANTAPAPPPGGTHVPFNDAKAHYESLTNLFKYCITGIGVLAGAVCFFVGYITYSNGQEFKQEQKEQKKALEEYIAAQKAAQKESEKELLSKEAELTNNMQEWRTQIRDEIKFTRELALAEINGIKGVATSEAKNRIDQVFRDKNFDDFVAKVANERMEPQINNLVDTRFSQLKQERIALFNMLIDSLASSNNITAVNAVFEIQKIPDSEFTEAYYTKIFSATKNANVIPDITNRLFLILVTKNSPLVNSFFKSYLYEIKDNPTDKGVRFTAALENLMYQRVKNDFYFFEDLAIKSASKNMFKNIFSGYANTDADMAIKFLNSTRAVDHVYSLLSKEEKMIFRNEMSGFTQLPADYTKTYFFTKKIDY